MLFGPQIKILIELQSFDPSRIGLFSIPNYVYTLFFSISFELASFQLIYQGRVQNVCFGNIYN